MPGVEQIESVDFDSMSADDWETHLEEHPDRALQAADPKGTHEFSYEPDVGYVTFWAHGSQGYDADGSRAALEAVAGSSDGLVLVGYERGVDTDTDGGQNNE
jgi:hypothetical protein